MHRTICNVATGEVVQVQLTQEEIDHIASVAVPDQHIPQSVTALQALLAIDQAGLAAAFEAWATDPARTFAHRAFIDKAQNWRRDDATLGAAAVSLGLGSEQVDALFILAATL